MKQVLTVSCKLEVSPEQSIKIDATFQAFANACEYVNQTVPLTLTNELAMQSLIYHFVD
ncbi:MULTISPECIES: hypothetical protein [unclassified Microcoleus]|uniref:hypothetical protein n=1 Tax=unclassified Microcoleus TaxID=2642155 RepID=UPI001DFFDA09|nr:MULTISPECIES: hypothetical protein [unclassified Microcoleus]MCC3506622.1 hypothetical protein [Microcoleus sp. PH2017_19_SFW_U_A]MCC3473861.1 hypothetical protein [Microcoleus sp. PH2017_13_LAR_U_A]MCC3486298.1 hypothetical protein [Microcoleus sp. PH2017_14_LAR_D_A]MCC3500479.1 hypothetical protein [Microcoleus sp. PH2017_15_JOR_U_A]MCC3525984.1 hypothetical protein [Microcoleus sp. PH2017_20_SFW_D_A]